MATIRRVPPPSQRIITDETGLVQKDWYDWFNSIEGTIQNFEQNFAQTYGVTRLTEPVTRLWIDIVNGNDANDGRTADTAFQTPQAAVNHVIKYFHLNNNAVEFFYRWRDDGGGNPIEYPGAIWAYPFLGSPHDFAITVRGEKDGSGNVRVRIADGGNGCIHAAEGAQVYVHDIAVRSTAAGVPALKAAFNGKLFLYNVVIYTGGGSMIEAGPRGGSIDVNGALSINQFAAATSTGLTNAMDNGAIISVAGQTWTLTGSPQFTFGMLNASMRGLQELRHTWAGTAIGRKWTLQSDGMFATGNPGAAGLDAWVPGTIAGASLDGGAWNIL